MPEILLTHTNHVYSDPKQTSKMQPWPPLQTLLAAAVLRGKGIEPGLFDPALLETPREDFVQTVDGGTPRLIVVCEDDFNFLSKMCLGHSRELAFWMAATAQRRGIPIAAHGSDASDHPAEFLAAGFDYVIVGEVEETLLELAAGRPPYEIAGLVYREPSGSVRINPRRALQTNLDALPLPAWDLVDMEVYRRAWLAEHGYFALNLASSRGCPYPCNWCAKPIHGNSYHARSPRAVAEEMLLLKQRYKPDRLWFADDIFALSHRWTKDFAAAVEELDAALPFKMQSRCDLMTRDTVAALRSAGAEEVWMGAESGSQKILDAMDKGIQIEEIFAARENLRRHGIRAGFFLQLGYPGEVWADIEATIQMVRDAKPDDIGVSVAYPLPGTKFHQIVSSQIRGKSNWQDSSDLAMIFRGTWSTEFYRALADALHIEVRGEAGSTSPAEAWRRVEELRDAQASLAGASFVEGLSACGTLALGLV